MAAINLLQSYGSDSDSSGEANEDSVPALDSFKTMIVLKDKFQINSAPLVETKVC